MMSERKNIYADRAFYKKSGGKSWLVIRSGEEPELPYQINMIKYNNIEGLLPVQFFIEDGEYRYFYDVSCKESLSERMKQKKYSIKEIRTIMSDLYRCVQQMEEYLLDTDCLILEPEYLFTDKSNFKIQFCFYQDKKESFEKSLENLFDYLLNHLDYQDEKTVVLVYSLYQKSREKNVPLYELMKQFCELPSSEHKKENSEKVCEEDTEGYTAQFQEKGYQKTGNLEEFGEKKNISRILSKEKQKEGLLINQKLDYVVRFIPYIPDVAGGFGIARILWYISKNHTQMSGRTFLFWMLGIAAILAVCGIISTILSGFAGTCCDGNEEKPNERRREKTEIQEQPEKNSPGQWYDKSRGEQIQENNEDKTVNAFQEFSFEDFDEHVEEININQDSDTDTIPATIVMSEPELFRIFNPVLVSKNKDKFEDIVIKERTMVVGKLRGISDVCLDGRSISRVHARISQDQNGCGVTDLGSTNGTYINGMRLAERQTRYLEQGDEVRFAEAIFEFRSEESEKPRSQQLSEVI